MLVTYSGLIKSLLAPPPNPYSTDPPEWVRHVEWLTILSQNIMSAANDLRPVQARVNLEAMMERQLELRRQETVELKKYGRSFLLKRPKKRISHFYTWNR